MFALPFVGLLLSLAPYGGPVFAGSDPATAKFAVNVRGQAGQTVDLRAVGVPSGFIASFCTARVCAPFAVTIMLPDTGRTSIELQLIEDRPGARKPKRVTVAARGARPAAIDFALAAH